MLELAQNRPSLKWYGACVHLVTSCHLVRQLVNKCEVSVATWLRNTLRSSAAGWVSIEVQGEVPSLAGITLPEEAGCQFARHKYITEMMKILQREDWCRPETSQLVMLY